MIKPDGKIEKGVQRENRVFKSGERIRFAFKTNKEGYIYLLLIGSSGRGRSLFPDPRINRGEKFSNEEYKIFESHSGRNLLLWMLHQGKKKF